MLYDIKAFSALYRRTKKAIGVNGETVRIELRRIGPGKVRVLTHVTVENRTSADTDCRLGVDHGGVDHYLDEIDDLAISELAVSRSDVLLGEGDVFFAELTGTTTGDELVMTAIGWEQAL